MKANEERDLRNQLSVFSLRRIHNFIVVSLILFSLAGSTWAAPAKAPKIIQVYATAETSNSAEVVWNTNVASDSLIQYSTNNPIPANAPQVYSPAQVTVHDIPLTGLAPGTLYFYRVTSCNKRGCATASGSFDTFPSCPDVVPPISGSWQRQLSPNVSGATALTNQLLSVAALSSTDAWVVGWAQDPNGPPYLKRTLTEHFDGTAWSIVTSPNVPNDTQSVLYSVSGSSANDVWAVGATHNGTLPSRTLIEHWDGLQWTIVSSPSPDSQLNELQGVAAISANDVWAVGFRGGTHTETPLETLILHWNGINWSQVPSPNIPGGANQLAGIKAISANDIWAVGNAAGGPLTMHWDGIAWRIVYLPVSSGLSSERLISVSGSAGNDVWAVGSGKGIFSNQTFATIHHWDGSRWAEKLCYAASASNPPDGYEGGGPDAYFTGVSAAAGNDVWVVGVRGSGPTIRHWDGVGLTTVTHPRAFPNSAILRAVATSSGGIAWSVGGEYEVSPSGSASPERTLIYKYTP